MFSCGNASLWVPSPLPPNRSIGCVSISSGLLIKSCSLAQALPHRPNDDPRGGLYFVSHWMVFLRVLLWKPKLASSRIIGTFRQMGWTVLLEETFWQTGTSGTCHAGGPTISKLPPGWFPAIRCLRFLAFYLVRWECPFNPQVRRSAI